MNKITSLILTGVLAGFSVDSLAEWKTWSSIDEMNGSKVMYASSPSTGPTKTMDFPYSNITASLILGCDSDSQWAYIKFSKAPIIADSKTGSGHNNFYSKLKWDEEVTYSRFVQKWGADTLHFSNDAFSDSSSAITNILKYNKLLVELDWYKNGKTYFKFSLDGTTEAVKKMGNECYFPHTESLKDKLYLKNKAIEENLRKEYFLLDFFDRKNILIKGNVVTAMLRDSSNTPAHSLSKMLSLIDKAASKADENYELSIKVIGNPENKKTPEDNFSVNDITALVVRVLNEKPKIKSHVKSAVVEKIELAYYTKEDVSGLLTGRIKNTRQEVEISIKTH